MKKEFIEKVIRTGTVDTRTYRYSVKEYADHMEVCRIHLSDLDTTASLDSWETVWASEEDEDTTKKFYAYEMDAEDNDWGFGTYDWREACEWLEEQHASGNDEARIATIEEGSDPICIDITTWYDI